MCMTIYLMNQAQLKYFPVSACINKREYVR